MDGIQSIEAKRDVSKVEDVVLDNGISSLPSRFNFIRSMSDAEYAQCEKTLKRKLDVRLVAMVMLIYILNFLDRNNIAAAGVAGIQETLQLTSTQFSTAVSILFVGYILMQVPSNMFLTQLRPSLYLPACMVAWGTISACTGVVQSAGGLYAVRLLLGIVEAAFYPGSVFLIASWYRRSEMGFRVALLYSGSQVGSATSGLIAAGITHGLDGAEGMPSWRWIFIIEGSITFSIAILAFLVLPDYPSNTRWLTEQERILAEFRLLEDAGQIDEDKSESWAAGFTAAFKDWRTYVFALMFACAIVSSSSQNFFPIVVSTLGMNTIDTLLLTVPPYALGFIVMILNNLSADHFRNSSFHIMWPFAVAMLGFILSASTTTFGPRYFAMCIMVAGGHGANSVITAWTQKTMLRPRIKRAAVAAFVNAFGNSCQIWTSYLYSADAAPRFVLVMSVNSGFALLGICLAFFMRQVLIRANKKRAAGEGDLSEIVTGGDRLARVGGFRYVT